MSRKGRRTVDWNQFVSEQREAYKIQQNKIPKEELGMLKESIYHDVMLIQGKVKTMQLEIKDFHNVVKAHYSQIKELQDFIRKCRFHANKSWDLSEKYYEYVVAGYKFIDRCKVLLHHFISDEQIEKFIAESKEFTTETHKILWCNDNKQYYTFIKLKEQLEVKYKECVGMMPYDIQEVIVFDHWDANEQVKLGVIVQVNKRWYNVIMTKYRTNYESERNDRIDYIAWCKYHSYALAFKYWKEWSDCDNYRRDMRTFRDRYTKQVMDDFKITKPKMDIPIMALCDRWYYECKKYEKEREIIPHEKDIKYKINILEIDDLMEELYKKEVKHAHDFVGTIEPGRLYRILEVEYAEEPEAGKLWEYFKTMFPSYYYTPLNIFCETTLALIKDYNSLNYKNYVGCWDSDSDEENKIKFAF